MSLLAQLVELSITVYIWVIILQVALHWLIAFDVVNASNQQAKNLIELLEKLTDPVYRPLRKYVPPIGGIDITPIIVILGLSILQNVLVGLLT
jgi:YggT family protein